MVKIFFFIVFAFYPFISFSLETDNFTRRFERIQDSTEVLNREMNRKLILALEDANKKEIPCTDHTQLRLTVKKYIYEEDYFYRGALENFALKSKDIQKHQVLVSQSVYKDVFQYNFGVQMFGLAPSIKLNDVYIGTDKLGHFINEGFSIFKRYIDSKDRNNMMDSVHHEEKLTFGDAVTGIYSYADMAANYKGFLFWEKLTRTEQPYFTCQVTNGKSKWSYNQAFKFQDFVDEAWDEGINCSIFSDHNKEMQFQNALTNLGKSLHKEGRFKCPMTETGCNDIIKNYPNYLHSKLINPTCVIRATQSPAKARKANEQITR